MLSGRLHRACSLTNRLDDSVSNLFVKEQLNSPGIENRNEPKEADQKSSDENQKLKNVPKKHDCIEYRLAPSKINRNQTHCLMLVLANNFASLDAQWHQIDKAIFRLFAQLLGSMLARTPQGGSHASHASHYIEATEANGRG